MYIPMMRERVEIAGRTGVFIIVDVNLDVERVNVIALTGKAYFEEHISFAAIRPYERKALLESE
jgi:hypothetical protein